MVDERRDPNDADDPPHDGLAHLVGNDAPDSTRPALGKYSMALCGRVFVPREDPGQFPPCPRCWARAEREGVRFVGRHR